MPITPQQHAVIAQWVGPDATTAELDPLYDYGINEAPAAPLEWAALAYVRRQRKELIDAGPITWAATGDYSESWAANLERLDDIIAGLVKDISAVDATDPNAVAFIPLERTDRHRIRDRRG